MLKALLRPVTTAGLVLALAPASGAQTTGAPACARVTVRQIAMTPREDGTRAAQFRATVQADPASCVLVQYDVMRSYLQPNGTTFEGAIPVRTEVRGGTAIVTGEDVAQTRGVIYWWAKNVSCQPCEARTDAPQPVAQQPAPSHYRRPGGSRGSGSTIGPKAAVAGAAGAATLAGLFLIGAGEGAASTEDAGNTPTPVPTLAPTTPPSTGTPTPAPTARPTVASTSTPAPQSTPNVFPGSAPPPASTSGSGSLDLASTDPGGGATVRSNRTLVTNFTVYPEQAGTDMRLELQFFSGGQVCIRDVTAPLPLRTNQSNTVTAGISSGSWSCPAPFRTTLLRVYYSDRGAPKFFEDFAVGWDFVQ